MLALFPSSKGDLPHGDAVSLRGLELMRDLGLTGNDLVVCHQMLESWIIGMHLYDLAGAPWHLEIRRQRRRRLNDVDVDNLSRTNEDIERVNTDAFNAGLDALVDHCEARAGRSRQPARRPTKRPQ